MRVVTALGLATIFASCTVNGRAQVGSDLSMARDLGASGDMAMVVVSPLQITPADQVITVALGQTAMPVNYSAKYNGNPVDVHWTMDNSTIGTIDATSGVFTPVSTVGGKASITATYGSDTTHTTVTVLVTTTKNGDPNFGSSAPVGYGGYGGVGGNGPGGPASSTQITTLGQTATLDSNVLILYPSDKVLWPRGQLAPLIQWDPKTHNFDSMLLHMYGTTVDVTSTFTAQVGHPFVNLPIPQALWDLVAASNAGDAVKVDITFGEGSNAVGPYSLTWNFAHAALKGTIYYNTYGTHLATSSWGLGASVLSIKPGATAPTLVTDSNACRTCHTVSPDGKATYVQQDVNNQTSRFDLLSANAESTLTVNRLAFPAIHPDGTLAFSSSSGSAQPSTDLAAYCDTTSRLYTWPAGALVSTTGLPIGFQATLPTFSPDGKHIAFVYWAGSPDGSGPAGDQKSLAMIDFDKGSNTFSNLQVLATPTTGQSAWPAFLPNGNGIVYEVQLTAASNCAANDNPNNDPQYGFTRDCIRAELWYFDLVNKTNVRLDNLNGKGYLPVGPISPEAVSMHSDDSTVNYEPTVNPIVSGGYAWVVFTSRRMYGNVAALNPWYSDARNGTVYAAMMTGNTPKKLWVGALDLNAPAGTDPSHPAFYLPAQELSAGNSRGFWSPDPCHADGATCASGDECCGGCCEPGTGGTMVCSAPAVDKGYCSSTDNCSALYDKCTIDADCCDATASGSGVSCINGRCSEPPIN